MRVYIKALLAWAFSPFIFAIVLPLIAFMDWLVDEKGAVDYFISSWISWAFMKEPTK